MNESQKWVKSNRVEKKLLQIVKPDLKILNKKLLQIATPAEFRDPRIHKPCKCWRDRDVSQSARSDYDGGDHYDY